MFCSYTPQDSKVLITWQGVCLEEDFPFWSSECEKTERVKAEQGKAVGGGKRVEKKPLFRYRQHQVTRDRMPNKARLSKREFPSYAEDAKN